MQYYFYKIPRSVLDKNGDLMTSFSPEHRPHLSSASGGALSLSELGANNIGKKLCGIITRTHSEARPVGVAAHRPSTASSFSQKFPDSIRRTLILVLAFVALLLAPLPAISQMTGDLELALKMQKTGKLRDAIEIYSEAIKKNPKSAEAYNWRGMAYDDLGETDKALQDFSKAIEISPNYADAYNNRGEIYREKKMNREAINDYMKAVQLEPNFAEAHYNLGVASELENRLAAAAAGYENYLKYKPDAADKSELEAKIKSLRQAAAAQPRPGPPPVPQKPGEPTQVQTQAGPRPGPAGADRAPAVAKPATPGGIDLGIPGVPEISPDILIGLITGIGILGAIIPVIFYLFVSFMLFLIAKKTNTSLPWLAFVPIANIVLILNIAGKPLWWLLLLLLPIASPALAIVGTVDPTDGILVMVLMLILILIPVVAWLFISLEIARARGKSAFWGILLFIPCGITSLIALAYLGLSD